MSIDVHAQRILILDFGSQYTQLIARRVREEGVYCEIHPYDWSHEKILAFAARGVILSGGPESVIEGDSPRIPAMIFELGVPVLGICYGLQAMALQLGGEVESSQQREYGFAEVTLTERSKLLDGIEDGTDSRGQGTLNVWMSHGDRVSCLPSGFRCIAVSDHAPMAGIADENRQFYGLQFHPEVTHTVQGGRMLHRFVREICGCAGLWTAGNIIEDIVKRIREQVGNEEVLLALSGGVDSSVTALLIHRAIGERLTCAFVDNGLLRLHEVEQVETIFHKHLGVNLRTLRGSDRFYHALQGVIDPEKKRKVIGRLFIEIFEEVAQTLPQITWLAQGTIYSDVIESAAAQTGKAHLIKSHHNVGGLPERMNLKLIEPLRELFKDEVRKIGLELGLPFDVIQRHPFPGPGLGVRILGEVREEYATILRQADHLFIQLLHQHEIYHKVSQAFAVFLPVKSVGVAGDGRRYDHVIALRAVETIDFMTARWAHLPHDFLDLVARTILNEVKGVSRVVYDISGKPPATIEWE